MRKLIFIVFLVIAMNANGVDRKPVVIYNPYFKTEEEVKNDQLKAEKGDAEASFELFWYYSFGKNDDETAINWLTLSAKQGNLSARLQYADFCISDKYKCQDDEVLMYLFSVIAEADEQELVNRAYISLGDYYKDKNPSKSVQYYKYAAAFSEREAIFDMLEHYQEKEDSIYDELYWISMEIPLVLEGGTLYKELLERRGQINKQLKEIAISKSEKGEAD